MAEEIGRLWQCNYCSACFVSSSLLRRHLDEYRSRAAEAENCRAHANANTEDDFEDPSDDIEQLETIRKNTKCPHKGCDRSKPFQKGQQLRVHFRRHVTCEEVCVYCFKVFRLTSEYIRHTREHGDTVEEKTAYTKRRCARLIKQTNRELLTQLRGITQNGSKKRTWAESSLQCDEIGVVTVDSSCGGVSSRRRIGSSGMSHDISLGSVLMDTSLASVPVPGVIEQMTHSETPVNLQPTDMFIPVQEDDDMYTPPLFFRMNFCRYPPSADLGLAMENTSNIDSVGLHHIV